MTKNVSATVSATNTVVIAHALGGEMKFVDTDSVLTNVGFSPYVSATSGTPNLQYAQGTSGSANQNANFGVIVAGHGSAVATAEQLSKTETYRDPDSFADIVRGMHLYGRKILRPEAIVTAKYNAA